MRSPASPRGVPQLRDGLDVRSSSLPFAIAPLLTGRFVERFRRQLLYDGAVGARYVAGRRERELRVLTSTLARTDSARYERTTFRATTSAASTPSCAGVRDRVGVPDGDGRHGVCSSPAPTSPICCSGEGAARRTEIGVRLAIGASRGRLIRQLLTESFLIAALGSALGFAVAWSLVRIIPAAAPAEAGLDATFLRAGPSRAACSPALLCVVDDAAVRRAARDPRGVVARRERHQGRRRATGRRRRGGLVGVQTALCVVLLAVASLFLRSISSMQRRRSGIRSGGRSSTWRSI